MLKNTANLLNLQNLMKRDPQSYLEEFRQQQRHFMANLQIFQSSLLASGGTSAAGGTASTGAASVAPSALGQQSGTSGAKQHKFHKDFGGLVTFLAHVSPCFKVESSLYSSQLLSLLTSHYEILDPPLRKTIVQAVILLQNRGLLDRMTLLPILFQLFKIQDKPLRLLLFHHIISDIKRINLKKVPGYLRINSQLQNYMYTMLSDKTSPIAAKKSLDVMIDLWRRKIWNDEKTVHAIQAATFSKDTRIKVTALRFFLGMTFYDEEEEEEEEEEKATIRAKLSVQKTALKGVTKKRKKAEREMKRATKKINKEDGKGNSGSSVRDDCPAILLLHDPQTYAERLFTMVKNSNESFQVRMLIMNVISRLIGAHRLIVLNFYPFLQKYMQPHQKNVTHILTYLAQATHPHVPPDVLQPCVRTLANHFVNDRSSPEVTAVGLNAIREICARAPLVMDSELLWDLVAYKKDKNKGVMMASRSLIALFRDINPLLLKRKERGKHASEFDETEVEFGFEKVRTDIVGADLLQQINETKQDDAGQVGRKGYRALLGDEWEIDDGDSDEDEDEDLGTSTKEVNNFLRMMEESDDDEPEGDRKVSVKKSNKKLTKKAQAKIATAARRAAKEEAKKAAAKDGKAASAEESDEEMEDGEEASDDDEEGEEDDEDGEEMDFDLEDGERIEGSGSENDEDDDDDDDEEEEEEEEKSSSNASKKRKTSMGAVTTATETAEEAAEADGEEESKEPAKPALPYGATHIFTPRDFEALKAARLQSALNPKKRQPHKREDGTTLLASSAYFDMEEGEDEDGNRVVQRQRRDTVGDVVDEMAIVGYRKQKHRTKEERLAAVHASRMDGINTKKKGGGSTNYDKEKNKPFVLTKHSDSVRRKKQRSFSQQQQAFSGHLKNMKHMTKKAKKQLKRHKSSKMAGKA